MHAPKSRSKLTTASKLRLSYLPQNYMLQCSRACKMLISYFHPISITNLFFCRRLKRWKIFKFKRKRRRERYNNNHYNDYKKIKHFDVKYPDRYKSNLQAILTLATYNFIYWCDSIALSIILEFQFLSYALSTIGYLYASA